MERADVVQEEEKNANGRARRRVFKSQSHKLAQTDTVLPIPRLVRVFALFCSVSRVFIHGNTSYFHNDIRFKIQAGHSLLRPSPHQCPHAPSHRSSESDKGVH